MAPLMSSAHNIVSGWQSESKQSKRREHAHVFFLCFKHKVEGTLGKDGRHFETAKQRSAV